MPAKPLISTARFRICPWRRAYQRVLHGLIPLLCAVLGACSESAPDHWQGYVEGEYRYLSSTGSGALTELNVRRGQRVAAGAPLFAIDASTEQAEVLRLNAQQAQQTAVLNNLQSGQRPEELAVLRAQLAQAQSQFKLSTAQWQRVQVMQTKQLTSAEQFDAARTAYERDSERLKEVKARLNVARLGARRDEIEAARSALKAVEASLSQARWRLGQKQVSAPVAGLIHDTLYQPGEVVASARPVVILLPDDGRKLRFFVPEHARASLQLGALVSLSCDGCTPDLTARINYFSEQLEFTPPVLLNRDNRQVLLFRVEAQPLGSEPLAVGLPVEVRLLQTGATAQPEVRSP